MNKMERRMVIYYQDIMNITGRKEKTARQIYNTVLRHFNKKKNDYLSVKEFCEYMQFREDEVKAFIR